MHPRRWVVVSVMAGTLLAGSWALFRGPRPLEASDAPERGADMPKGGATYLLTLGLKDTAATAWDGEIRPSAGSVRSLAVLPDETPLEGRSWSLGTRPVAAAKQAKKAGPARIAPVRLLVTLDVPAAASVEVASKPGTFAFTPGKLAYGSHAMFLDGAASVERVPLTVRLTRNDDDDDVPATALDADGNLWCVSASYRHGPPIRMQEVEQGQFGSLVPKDHGDRLLLRKFDGTSWSPPMEVTGDGRDVWRPCMAVADSGDVWVVWSENRDGNWDLHARCFHPKSSRWDDARRLTEAEGPDLNVVAVRAAGRRGVWIAWQGWREKNFEILLGRLDGEGPIRERRVSTSAANDWNPALAAGDDGSLWVAWDTYQKGDYDVYARTFRDGELDRPTAIATSAKFEARPSVAVDRQGRVWIAYEQSGENWGKDYGSRFPGRQGVPFYIEKTFRVRCLEGGKLRETKAALQTEPILTHYDDPKIPKVPHERASFPRLAIDDRGGLWVLYRRHPSTFGDEERWISLASRYDGEGWSSPAVLRHSENLLDNRPALAADREDGLLVVYSGDGRTDGSATAKTNELYAARLGMAESAAAPSLVGVTAEGPPSENAPIHPDEADEVRRIRDYRINLAGTTYRPLRGDFHRHTEISAHRDWDGPVEDLWRYGLDVAALDWIGITDHEYAVQHEYMWWLTQKQDDLFFLEGRFLPMFTYERSLPYPTGHRNVMFAGRGVRYLPALEGKDRRFGSPERGAPDIKNLYAYLREFDGICSSHTSATSMGTDWRDNDPTVEPVVEIFQGHRQNYEEPKAPLAAKDAADSIQGYEPAGFVWNALARGYRLGFQVSSDHVSTHISYAVALVGEPTRRGVLDAFKRRHTYGAHDNIILDVRCGDHLMGDELTIKKRPRLDIVAIGTAPIARVDVVRQVGTAAPAYVFVSEPKTRKVSFRWTDEAAEPGSTHLYYVRITQEDKKMAWASPLWVHYRP